MFLRRCRDPACGRPYGVRLRGNDWFYHLIFHICAAPLRMTRRLIVAWVIQYSSVKVTLQRMGFISQNVTPLCYPERSGVSLEWRTIQSIKAAQSNPKGERQAEFRHLRKGEHIRVVSVLSFAKPENVLWELPGRESVTPRTFALFPKSFCLFMRFFQKRPLLFAKDMV